MILKRSRIFEVFRSDDYSNLEDFVGASSDLIDRGLQLFWCGVISEKYTQKGFTLESNCSRWGSKPFVERSPAGRGDRLADSSPKPDVGSSGGGQEAPAVPASRC